ncbi:hypothetical protein HPP92_014970 [Vanilla planifolia]|uniref:Leucine-rich repeat-containing N-terminal plant-type domain-containing protein n=1 Tax=Vanilla planifolia TaxID=51239 RepID=A0A835UTM2_VANPL|nr:hypothetical protein HPP92_014970 [Vanilla planifolia]
MGQLSTALQAYRLFLLFVALSSAGISVSGAACSDSDRAALIELKSGLTDPYIGVFSSWTSKDCCSGWYGVACDPDTGRVTDLVLRGESEDPILTMAGRPGLITGGISPAVCRLDHISTLVIADWKQISGPIPACITSLSSLRVLDLIGNRLTGSLPSNLGKLYHLAILNVADNQITGPIPESLTQMGSLMHLNLANNQLSGSIPSDFGNLKMLSRALLGRNRLSGVIPSSIGQMNRLADLDLTENQIWGSIPASLASMPVLSSLYLGSNRLTGGIPAVLLGNKGLGILNLSRNAIEGPIPDAFTSISYFTTLDLSYNKLTGDLPKTLLTAAYVGHIDLSNNHLCGRIPTASPFDRLDASSFANNDCLCGWPLQACAS